LERGAGSPEHPAPINAAITEKQETIEPASEFKARLREKVMAVTGRHRQG
jgi:hypothetical protein